MAWINIKDKLPEDGQLIDLWDSENERRICNYRYYKRLGFFPCVLHWMPTPEPPE